MTREHERLVGLSILRILVGSACVMYYLADYSERAYLWGPNGYKTLAAARSELPRGAYSLYLFDNSDLWFQSVFHLGLAVAAVFTVCGGRWATVGNAVLMWSILLRNQDLIEGGDYLARIALVLMIGTVTNAYFAPGAAARRAALVSKTPTHTLVHNFFVTAILFQVAVVYFVSGCWKVSASMWTDGTAMYYISHLHEYSMTPLFGTLMDNAFASWITSYASMILELAVPFAMVSGRAAVRGTVAALLVGMHIGIMFFMGLVPFALIMIGADLMMIADDDYRRRRTGFRSRLRAASRRFLAGFGAPRTARRR